MSKFNVFKTDDETYAVVFYGLPTIAKKVNKLVGNYYPVIDFSPVDTPMFKLNIFELKAVIEALHVAPGKSRKVSTLLTKYLKTESLDQIYSI